VQQVAENAKGYKRRSGFGTRKSAPENAPKDALLNQRLCFATSNQRLTLVE